MKILIGVLAALAVVIGGGLAWLGAFSPVQVQEREVGPYSYVYVLEPSADSGQVGPLTEALGRRLETAGFRDRRPAQVYYPQGRGIQNQIGFMVDRAPPANEVLGADTFFRPIPVQRYLVARFPYRNALSFMVGGARVDAAFAERRAERRYAETQVIVIRDGDSILYLQPIEPA